MLHDPLLPPELLSSDWVGWHAHRLCAAIYRAVLEPSERFLAQLARADEGLRRTGDPRVWARFQGAGDGAAAVPPHSPASA
jgi:phenylacetic acid degradation operon negative regulatory protein